MTQKNWDGGLGRTKTWTDGLGAVEAYLAVAGYAARAGYFPLHGMLWQQQRLAVLLGQQAQRKLLGHGSSMPVEEAEVLLQSVVYTLGAALKTCKNIDEAAQVLAGKKRLDVPNRPGADDMGIVGVETEALEAVYTDEQMQLETLFAAGQRLLKKNLKQAENLWRAAKNIRLHTQNYSYNSTLGPGLGLFFARYDLYYWAAETPGDIDYQLGATRSHTNTIPLTKSLWALRPYSAKNGGLPA